MDASSKLATHISQASRIGKVVDYDSLADHLCRLDLTATNPELDADTIADIDKFSGWIEMQLQINHSRYGIGGYMEHRTVYARSALFDADDEPRRLHLGMDIWGAAGTAVYSPLEATLHSFNDNDNFGDYGPTIILKHQVNGFTFYSLYGHLSRASLSGLRSGQQIYSGQQIGQFGTAGENGCWPPHLHFQLILDMEGKAGDYPGVCRYSEKAKYLQNIPDPNIILQFPG